MEENQWLIEKAKDLLERYKDLERISLLELAVWKFACLTADPKNHGEIKSIVDWSRWYTNGWKEHKKRLYRCNQIVILMKAIVPFLQDKETDEELIDSEDEESENDVQVLHTS